MILALASCEVWFGAEGTMIEWFDDLTLGMRFKSGEVSVTKEDIIRFATEFDPQPFHIDEVAAENTAFNGLAASGACWPVPTATAPSSTTVTAAGTSPRSWTRTRPSWAGRSMMPLAGS